MWKSPLTSPCSNYNEQKSNSIHAPSYPPPHHLHPLPAHLHDHSAVGIGCGGGTAVRAGQPLLRLQSDILDTKLCLLALQQGEKQDYIHDQAKLTNLFQEHLITTPDAAMALELRPPLYRQQYEQLRFLNRESQQTEAKRQRELETSQKLLNDKVIARNEHEDKEFAWQSAVAQHQTQVERQRAE
ncbi:hypothetical protein [Spirosoma linguale]|uniref:Uncharacterized protein n=1 Tax=Spirosoma linguale (strain ATCC 33905 / DSM 74 / LMG 10896 / Claus 1) TaxID=504472 RepID=D2QK73_SPILD|nr:hypothetical protein Slin_1144 [Spirosoma linguale DSM 74]